MHKDYVEIVTTPLEVPTSEYERVYGLEFEGDTARFEDDLLQTIALMVDRRRFIRSPEPPTQVSYHVPSAFLREPLTIGQRGVINRIETPKVADYCVSVQDELAKVPIVERAERLRHLPDLFEEQGLQATFSDVPFHEACGEWAGRPRQFWAREKFADRLSIFGYLLNEAGVALHFEDGFRPVGVQEGLFKRRVDWTKRDYPDWSDAQIIQEARSKTAVMPRLASHKAGAAVDARLRSLATGQLLDFGHEYPDGGAIVFPKTPFITGEQWRNRQLFAVAAQLSGLTLYVGEDWHVSYGDNLASLTADGIVDPSYVAQYGPIKRFDDRANSGAVLETYAADELDRVFDI